MYARMNFLEKNTIFCCCFFNTKKKCFKHRFSWCITTCRQWQRTADWLIEHTITNNERKIQNNVRAKKCNERSHWQPQHRAMWHWCAYRMCAHDAFIKNFCAIECDGRGIHVIIIILTEVNMYTAGKKNKKRFR